MKKSGKKILYARLPGDTKFKSTEYEDTQQNRRIVKTMLDKYVQLNGKSDGANYYKSKTDINTMFEKYWEEKALPDLLPETRQSYRISFNKIITSNFDINEKIVLEDKILYHIEIEVKNFLKNNKEKPSSQNIYIRSFQAFLNWLSCEGYLNKKLEMFSKYKRKAADKEVIPFTEEEMTAIFKKALFMHSGLEFACWLLFCRYTGSRIKESLELRWEDVLIDERIIKFRNKIDKTKFDYFPITHRLIRILNVLKYLSEKRDINKDTLFKWKPSSKRFILKKLTEIEISLGIKKDGRGAHGIRKLFSQELFDAETEHLIDKSKITELMRHKDQRTTDKHYRVFKAKQLASTLESIKR